MVTAEKSQKKTNTIKYGLKESFLYLFSKVSSGLLSLLALSLISYYYSASQYGNFSLILANANIITIGFFYCLKLYYVRFNKNDKLKIEFKEIDSIINFIAIILLLISLTLTYFSNIYFLSVVLSILQIKFEIFQEKQRSEFKAIGFLMLSITKALIYILFIFIVSHLDYLNELQLFIAYIAPFLSLYIFNISKYSLKASISFETLKRIYIYGLAFILTPISNSILYNYYRYTINTKLGLEALGGFSYVSEICENTILAAMMAINLSGYPRLIKYFEEKDEYKYKKQSDLNICLQLTIILLILIGYGIFMPLIGNYIFHKNYMEYINTLFLLLMTGSFMKGLKYYYVDQYLLIYSNKSINIIVTTAYLILSFITLPIMINKYNIHGSAYAFIFTNSTYFITTILLFKLKYKEWILNYKFLVICSLIMTNILFINNNISINIFSLFALILILKRQRYSF